MKHLLVTTDLSEQSESACEIAKQLAEPLFAGVNLLAVLEPPMYPDLGYAIEVVPVIDPSIYQEIKKRADAELKLLTKSHFENLPHKIIVKEKKNSIKDTILETAKEVGANFIVMATHGRTGIRRAILGSVAEAVARESECPVILVPAKSTKK